MFKLNKLYFEKISRHDRPREPVSLSIPFGEGRFKDSDYLVVRDGSKPLPVQQRILSTWPDGSVRWLRAHMQPDLPGNAGKTLTFDIEDNQGDFDLDSRVSVEETGNGLSVDTCKIAFKVPNSGYRPLADISMHNEPILGEDLLGGFVIDLPDRRLNSRRGEVEIGLEDKGPLLTSVLVKGKHQSEEGIPFLDYEGRITAYAGKPYVQVEYRFLHKEETETLSLRECRLDFTPDQGENPEVALGEGYYRTSIERGQGPFQKLINGETLLYQSYEHFVVSFYGDFWADWRNEEAGLAMSIYKSHQNFPKALQVDGNGISCYLYPGQSPPTEIRMGVAKTHMILLHFHGPEKPLSEISARSLQFQIPDIPSLTRNWYRDNNPWAMEFFPEKIPSRLITDLVRTHDGRPEALGMLHFGDSPDAGYSDQGRGKGRVVWVNNEYDRGHACTLFYALTGIRRALDSALVSARHWLDVDICHYSKDPLREGGLITHSANHVEAGVTPSHEWVDGLLDYYYLTGRKEGLRSAHSVAQNIMRHMARPIMRREGKTSTRENGWALRAMVSMFLATGEEKYRKEARRIVELFIEWNEKYGGLLAPYTDHSMPRVVFMNAITGNSLARYLAIENDRNVEKLVLEIADDLIEQCLGPDGIFIYKELPSLAHPSPSPHALELMAHAYRISGEDRYLNIATRQFVLASKNLGGVSRGPKRLDESGALIRGHGSGRSFAESYTSIILFASMATPLGLLDWYEYPA